MVVVVLGFALAIGQCLTVGPVNAEALRRGLVGGFRPALAVEIGSSVGDGVWAALALTGLSALLALPFMDLGGSVLGFGLLTYLAIQSWRDTKPMGLDSDSRVADVSLPGSPTLLAQPSRLPAFWAGLLLGVVNPGSAVFWLGVGSTVLASHLPVIGPRALVEFSVGYYAGLIVWSIGFATLAGQLGQRLPSEAQILAQRAIAIFLGALAALSLVAVARRVAQF